MVSKKRSISTSNAHSYPCTANTRNRSKACVVLRLGLNPYEHSRKSASKIGSSTILAAICTTRSLTVGMPSGLCLPSPLGMYSRLTAGG